MLACARIGAIHSVVFGGFSSKELAVRIDDAQPKVSLCVCVCVCVWVCGCVWVFLSGCQFVCLVCPSVCLAWFVCLSVWSASLLRLLCLLWSVCLSGLSGPHVCLSFLFFLCLFCLFVWFAVSCLSVSCSVCPCSLTVSLSLPLVHISSFPFRLSCLRPEGWRARRSCPTSLCSMELSLSASTRSGMSRWP
jgi:hypothetical protein